MNSFPNFNPRHGFIWLGFVLLTAGCGQEIADEVHEQVVHEALETKTPSTDKFWVLRELYGREVQDIQGNSLPELQFDAAGGRFVGSTGCNHIHGNLVHKAAGIIAFEGTAQSLRACADMGLEDGFKRVLSETRYFKEKEMELTFLNQENTVIARFAGRQLDEKP